MTASADALAVQEIITTRTKVKSRLTGIANSINFAVIFSTFLKTTWHQLLEAKLKYLLFPAAALFDVIQAKNAWSQYLNDHKVQSLIKAIIETMAAGVIVFAVAAILMFTATFSLISPVLFTFVLAGKSLAHTLTGLWYSTKAAFFAKTEEERDQYYNTAFDNIVLGSVGAIATLAVGTVFALAKTVFAPLGILAGIAGATFGVYQLITMFNEKRAAQKAVAENDGSHEASNDLQLEDINEITSSATMVKTLSDPDNSLNLSRDATDSDIIVEVNKNQQPVSDEVKVKSFIPNSGTKASGCLSALFNQAVKTAEEINGAIQYATPECPTVCPIM